MKKTLRADEVEALLREIQRYLTYVDAFRTTDHRLPPVDQNRKKET